MGLPDTANNDSVWVGRTYHVRSNAGLQALAAEWRQPKLETDVDFTREELWLFLERSEYGCGERTARSLISNGKYVIAKYLVPPCNHPIATASPGPLRAIAYGFPRQGLPVLPARNPETPSYQLEVVASYRVASETLKKIVFTPDGALWAIGRTSNLVFRLSPGGYSWPAIVLNGPATDIAVAPSGDVWTLGGGCRRIDSQGQAVSVILDRRYDQIAIDGSGRLWLQRGDVESSIPLRIYGADGSPPALSTPSIPFVDNFVRAPDGSMWGTMGDSIMHFDANGQPQFDFPFVPAGGMAIDGKGNIWKIQGDGTVVCSNAEGRPVGYYSFARLGEQSDKPILAFDPQGALWIASQRLGEVVKYQIPN